MEPVERKILEGMNNGFGPISVPRGNKATRISLVMLTAYIIFSGICLYCGNDKNAVRSWYYELISLLLSVVAAILGELIRRSCIFYEEYSHVDARYLGKRKDAIVACFYQKNFTYVFIVGVICLIFISMLSRDEPAAFDIKHLEVILMGMFFMPSVSYLLGLGTPTVAEKSQINEAECNNIADGLVWSYYLGYLKLILPELDNTINKTNLVIDGVDFKDTVAVNQLFIIIPKNCYCYGSFDEMDQRIIRVDSTESLHISRAGVARRVYKHTIYKISAPERPFYCLMEYANPLQSIYDMYAMLKNDKRNPDMESKELDQQVVQFVKKLKEILEKDPRCRGKYRLVMMADAHENLADIMVREIIDTQISNPSL